jgi:hypothetical protein
MRKMPNASADVLTEFVLEHVARGSEVRTDAWKGYDHSIAGIVIAAEPD